MYKLPKYNLKNRVLRYCLQSFNWVGALAKTRAKVIATWAWPCFWSWKKNSRASLVVFCKFSLVYLIEVDAGIEIREKPGVGP